MNREEIEIAVHPDGRIEYTISGIKGAACADISAVLERLGRVEYEERTSEYYEKGDDAHVNIEG